MSIKPNARKIFWGTLAYAMVLSVLTLLSAIHSKQRVFPSFFFDPSGIYSIINIPSWDNESLRLSREEVVVRVDSISIDKTTGYLNYPGNRILSLLNSYYADRQTIPLSFANKTRTIVQTCPLRKIGNMEILLLYVVYLCFAWFSLLFTLILWKSIKENRAHIHVLLFAILLSFNFLLTFYDYHTMGWLAPIFQISNVVLPLTQLYLSFVYTCFSVKQSVLRVIQLFMGVYFICGVVDQMLLPLFNIRHHMSPAFIDAVTQGAFLLTGILILFHIISGKKKVRRSVFLVGLGNASVVLILGIGIVLSLDSQLPKLRFLVNLIMPVVPTLFILLFSYSVLRHNVLTIQTVFKRNIFMLPVLFLAMALAVASYTLLSFWSKHNPGLSILDVGVVLSLFFVFAWVFNRMTLRIFFNALRTFKPTIVQLSDYLSETRNESEIADTLRRVINQWLIYHKVYVIIASDGAEYSSAHCASDNLMSFPMLSHNKILGVISISSSPQSPLLTEEDLNLLRIIASIGAIGINNVRNMNTLDGLYQQNIDFTRKENLLSLQVFGAEIVHEIQYPITYFRYIFEELGNKQPLNAEDIQLGNDEIKRLESMVKSMQQYKHPTLNMQEVNVYETIKRVLILLKDILEKYHINPVIDIPPSTTLLADKSLLIQLFTNLIKNAAEASGENGEVVLGLQARDSAYAIVVKDSGPGLPDKDIFSPWVTTKKEGRGIGLTVCQRIVRSFDWTIQVSREGTMTCFYVNIPVPSFITV